MKTRGMTSFRWTICALLFAATTVNYMDRQILGLLAPQLQHDIGWTEVEYARIIIAFQAAYAIGLVGFGQMIDRMGTKIAYALAMVAWSLAAAGHALVGTVMGFAAMRFLLGLGEAGNFPAAVKAIAEWFPKHERASATGLFNSGSNFGAVLAPALIPFLAVTVGWRGAFVLIGALGLLWLPFWWILYRRPEESPQVNEAELEHIKDGETSTSEESLPWTSLIRRRQTWAFMLGKALTDPVWWFYLFWLPGWLNKQYGINLKNLGIPMITVYVMAIGGSIAGGWISSRLMARGLSANRGRKIAMIICACAVIPILIAVRAKSVWLAVPLVGLAAAAHQGWSANLYTTVSDMFPKRAVASVTGIGGMAGSVGSIIFSEAVGRVLQKTGTYWPLFAYGAFAYLVAFGVFHLLVPKIKPIDLSAEAAN
ncbi:MAG TPA: MFS transporter [Holophaga sp.]|nr:MFS transporter [Holophaga sp.]